MKQAAALVRSTRQEDAMPADAIPGPGYATTELHEVRAIFSDSARMQDAIDQLTMAGFDRADLSLPEADPPIERSTPESGAEVADTDEDARQARTVHTSTAAAAAAIAGAGIVAATGGAALPAVAAALVAGGVVGGGTYAISTAANVSEQQERDRRAASGTLILSVRATTSARREKASAILLAAGGTDCTTS
jgi:hypothetical protein